MTWFLILLFLGGLAYLGISFAVAAYWTWTGHPLGRHADHPANNREEE